ncbi:MAG: tetratricopeptide repeat protein [Clostridia bacterium]|nr:tetratricopeptide repeat protein [Clostridia bacterium]
MDGKDIILTKEDYEEAACPLCMRNDDVTPIDVMRMMDKLDAYLAKRDYAGAAKHLEFWLASADAGADKRGAFSVANEMMGVYRKMGEEEKALAAAERTIRLIRELENADTIAAATALLNAGTVHDAFGKYEKALTLFEAARDSYEKLLPESDPRMGGLYNNMAMTLANLGRYEEAEAGFEKALEVMRKQPDGRLEQAITYLNMADAVEMERGAEAGEERIMELLDRAEEIVFDEGIPHDGYYAFVCEKCAPCFGWHGRFMTKLELERRAAEIYRKNEREDDPGVSTSHNSARFA